MSKCVISFLILIASCSSLAAQVRNAGMEQALEYYEAGDFSHARMLYESVLEDKLSPWEREIIRYNSATSLLAEGKLEEAIAILEVLASGSPQLPLLQQRATSNLALAKIGLLEAKILALKDNPDATQDDYNDLYVLFREVLINIENAEASWCALEAAEGAAECSRSVYLDDMRLEVKKHLNVFLDDYLAFRLAHLSVQEGVLDLLVGEKILLRQLSILENKQFSGNLKDKYLADFVEKSDTWKPLWSALEGKVKAVAKNKGGDDRTLLRDARQNFFEGSAFAEKGDFLNAAKRLEASRISLNKLLENFFSSNSLNDVLKQLLTSYGLALIKAPLQEAYLDQILEIQTTLEPLIKKTVDTPLLKNYEQAQKYLKSSVEALNNSHPAKARLLAEVARFYIKDLAEQIDFNPKVKPETVLENAIAKQEFIFLLNHLKEQAQKNEKKTVDIGNLLSDLQQSTLNAADQFLVVVLARQREAFEAKEGGASRCQCRPWDEVIPLFSEGYSKASLAGQLMEESAHRQGAIQRLQRSAIENWKEALAKLRSKKESPKKEEKQEEQMEQEDQSRDEQKQSTQQIETLRMLQEMENDDKSQPQMIKASGSVKGEERPW